jgi:hypothetical protein
VEASELPCSLGAFVAMRRGISIEEAEELIAHWVETYEPRAVQAHLPPTEAGHDRADSLRNCG